MYMPILILTAATIIWHSKINVNNRLLYLLFYYAALLPFSCDIQTGLLSIMNIIIAICISSGLSKEKINEKCGLAFVIGLIICNIILFPSVITKFGFDLDYMITYRIPFMEGDITVGPNGWGQYLTLAVMIMLLVMYKKRNIQLFQAAIFASLFVFLFLTQSRAQLLSAAFVTFCAIMVIFTKNNQSNMTKIIISIGLLAAIAVLALKIRSGATRYSDIKDIVTLGKRVDIWDSGLSAFIDKMNPAQWLFGVGTGGTGVFIAMASNSGEEYINAHSMYLDSLIMSGLVGTILLLNYWFHTLIVLFRHRRESMAFVFPLWVLFLGLTTHFFANWPYLFAMTISEIAIGKYSVNSSKRKELYWRNTKQDIMNWESNQYEA